METVKVQPRNLSLRFPNAYRSFFAKGFEFIISRSGDTLLLKQIQRRPWPAEIPSSRKPMTLEEIDKLVHSVRKKARAKSQ